MNSTILALFNIGGMEIVLILALILILFGGKKLPELARGLGQGIKEFKKATREVTDEVQNAATEPGPTTPQSRPSAAPAHPETQQTVAQSTPSTPGPKA